jgi:hypothetical protein
VEIFVSIQNGGGEKWRQKGSLWKDWCGRQDEEEWTFFFIIP